MAEIIDGPSVLPPRTTARLRLNGEDCEYAQEGWPENLQALVKSLGLDPALVVAEVNGEIVKRQFYASRTLADRDSVEIVRLVGGG